MDTKEYTFRKRVRRLKLIEVVSMGINTDHRRGERRRDANGRPYYVLIQMLTPGFVNVSSGIRRIEPYECVLYPPRSPRNLSPQDEESSFRNNWVFFRGEGAREMLENYGVTPGRIYHPGALHSVSECFRMLFSEYIRPDGRDRELSTLIMRQIFIYLSRSNQVRADVPSADSSYEDQLAQMRFDIYQDVARPWSIEEMARQLGVSTTWFDKLYRAQYGVSPKQDVLRARIERAKGLLTFTEGSLREVAQLTGFQNEYYFSRAFRRRTGMAPGEYRRSRKGD